MATPKVISGSGSSAAIRRAAENTAEARHWWVYLPDVCPEAADWCEDYRRNGLAVSKRTDLAVRDLQRRRLEQAWCHLEACREELEALWGVAPRSVITVVEVAYLSALAYYHYHQLEADSARVVLARAEALIEETITLAPFLVPCAGQCYDYRLHLARIARTEASWQEMFEQVEIGRRMIGGAVPLCNPPSGAIYLDDVCAFYRNAVALNDFEREALALQGDPRTIQREFDNLCLAATVVPYIVVNWTGR